MLKNPQYMHVGLLIELPEFLKEPNIDAMEEDPEGESVPDFPDAESFPDDNTEHADLDSDLDEQMLNCELGDSDLETVRDMGLPADSVVSEHDEY
mmetsp:Transcript_3438/g.3999  ORF Transcript_3438/g.3999 Transcript_3438/m.3999 type:complete len:95 (+) Transcript_3438:857-1141(+)